MLNTSKAVRRLAIVAVAAAVLAGPSAASALTVPTPRTPAHTHRCAYGYGVDHGYEYDLASARVSCDFARNIQEVNPGAGSPRAWQGRAFDPVTRRQYLITVSTGIYAKHNPYAYATGPNGIWVRWNFLKSPLTWPAW